MMGEIYRCKYCGKELRGSNKSACSHCYEKIPLVKKLLNMTLPCEEQKEPVCMSEERGANDE